MSSSSHALLRTQLDPTAPTIASSPQECAISELNQPKVIASRIASHDPFTLASGEVSAGTVEIGKGELASFSTQIRYDVGPVLGVGGMGEVRLSSDSRIGRRVAKKTLLGETDSPTARARFLREARVQGQLEHPAIVPVYDLDLDAEGRPFFTMKRVRGDTLERIVDHLRRKDEAFVKRYAERRLLAAFVQVCLAVDYAHSRGVLHRDLKPGNIMLGDFGEVYVLDWGLAKIVGENLPDMAETNDGSRKTNAPPKVSQAPFGPEGLTSDDAALTAQGALLGTPAYMAPEQFLGHDAVDARADVFALGAILFEILTLSRLRTANRVDELVRAALSGSATQPSSLVASIAPELDALCLRALEQSPDERLSTARELAEGIERYLDGDRDLSLRRNLAATHLENARAFHASEKNETEGDSEESPRVHALREVIQALALDPEDRAAQKLFVQLIVHTTEVPRQAMPEIARVNDRLRSETMRAAFYGLLAWFAVVPMVLAIGIQNKPVIIMTAVMDLIAAAFALIQSRRKHFGSAVPIVFAVLIAATVALSSCYLGPLALMPTAAVSAMLLYAIQATPFERRAGVAIFVAFTALPYIGELTGIFGHAYIFESDRLIILARSVALPQFPTLLAMLYSTISFVILSAWIAGRMHDALSMSQQQKLVQSWLLRRLFPDAMADV